MLLQVNRWRSRLQDEDGASAVEYGLLVVAIAAVIVLVVFAMGGIVRHSFSHTCNSIGSSVSGAVTSSCSS